MFDWDDYPPLVRSRLDVSAHISDVQAEGVVLAIPAVLPKANLAGLPLASEAKSLDDKSPCIHTQTPLPHESNTTHVR